MCVWSGRETGLESLSLLQRGLSAARLAHQLTQNLSERFTKSRAVKSPVTQLLYFKIMLQYWFFTEGYFYNPETLNFFIKAALFVLARH